MATGHHHHHHAHELTGERLRLAVMLTAIILLVELAGGLISHSLALLSDAGHVLTDIAALGLAWFATAQSGRPADALKTYGYHRTGILAALANAVTLMLIVLAIIYEAVGRFQHAQSVQPGPMFIAAGVGIAINLYIALGFSRAEAHNLNVRAAMMHVLGDVAASAAVIVGGLVILATGWYLVDPLLSLLIALLIARGAWSILGETLSILMEATPKGLDAGQLARDVAALPGITEVHDLHVWSIAGGMHALSAHVQVTDDYSISACDDLLERVNGLLARRYGITHSTIQFEYACCDRHVPDDLYCSLREREDGHAHQHGPDPCHEEHRRTVEVAQGTADR